MSRSRWVVDWGLLPACGLWELLMIACSVSAVVARPVDGAIVSYSELLGSVDCDEDGDVSYKICHWHACGPSVQAPGSRPTFLHISRLLVVPSSGQPLPGSISQGEGIR